MRIEDEAPPSAPDQAPEEQRVAAPPALRWPITLYKARRRRRRWVRVTLWTIGTILLMGIAAAGGFIYFELYKPIQSVTDIHNQPELVEAQHSTAITPPPPPGHPTTALILGYDHRFSDGSAPSRSDTLMLIRVDPARDTLTLLSIPRDLRSDIPGHGVDKINAAYSLGKSKLALQTVEKLLAPIKINYLIPIDFHGFTQTVDQFGGVWIDVDRRYFNKNIGTYDTSYSDINLQPGYQRLGGQDALAYVRFRHTDSDIFRLARQQAFVREFKRQVDPVAAATNILGLVKIVKDNVKIVGALHHQPGIQTMWSYLRLLGSIPRGRMVSVRIQGDQGAYNQYVNASSTEIQQARQQFLYPDIKASETVTNRDVGGKVVGRHKGPRVVQPVAAGKLRVVTLNGTHIDMLAARSMTDLRNAGYRQARVGDFAGYDGNWRPQDVYATMVFYASKRPAVIAAARQLALSLGDADPPRPLPAKLRRLSGKTDTVLVAGSQYNGVTVPRTPNVPKKTVPDVQAVASHDVALFRSGQRRLGYPALYPTKVPKGSVFSDPDFPSISPLRVYEVDRKHGRGMHVTGSRYGYHQAEYYWGLQWLRWPTAPILDQPSGPARVKCGYLWKVYMNGPHIHRIAVFYGKKRQYVTWLDNSLNDGYSNATMVTVACSLSPIPRH